MCKNLMRLPASSKSQRFVLVCCLLLLSFCITSVSAGDVNHESKLQLYPPLPPLNNDLAAEKLNKQTKKINGIFSLLHPIQGVSLSLENHHNRHLRNTIHDTPVRELHDWRKLRGGGTASTEASMIASAKNITTSSIKATPSTAPLSAKRIDKQARSIALSFAWIVSAQVLMTVLHSCRAHVFEFASRFVKQDTLSAARSIRQILDTMDDHAIVDLLSHHPPLEILMSIYALAKLQAACQFQFRSTSTSETATVELALLQDLYDCLPFATAAYGWKFNLATSGKWHKNDEHALVKMTNVDPSDICTVNWEARPNRPAFYIVRDRKRKRIVLAIRGTWSAHDVLTDLCCTTEDYACTTKRGGGKRLRAHSGMLTAARGVAQLAEDTIAQELDNQAGYSLLLVGHSLGGSAAAVLGTLWAEKFPHANVTVYAYGPCCVFPESFHNNYKGANIVSVLLDGDPFSCLSLGHVADVSGALDYLCEDTDMRRQIGVHTDDSLKHISSRDLEWCSRTMADIKRGLTLTEKLYPPGQLLFIHKKPKHHSKRSDWMVQEVPPSLFQYWKLGPGMVDLTRHAPTFYQTTLRKSIISFKHQTTKTATENKQ